MTSDEAKKLVSPTWSGEARLPQTLRLPVEVSNAVWGVGNGQREIVVRRDGELPSFIIEWMKTSPKYRTWFLTGQSAETKMPNEVPDMTPKTQPKEELEAVSVTAGDETAVADEETMTFDTVEEMVKALDSGEWEPDKPKRGRRKKAADGE